MRVARLATLTILTACVDSSVVVCSDGVSVCPTGNICAPIANSDAFACVGGEQVCGNGVIEQFTLVDGVARSGETCDDGNRTPHDGCSSACSVEQPRWRQRDIRQPPAQTGAALAYDGRNSQFVMFGGLSSLLNADTWLGTFVSCGTDVCLGWERVTPPNAPSARFGASLAYDSAKHRIVLFGGNNLDDLFSETWEWDGVTWTELQIPVNARPSPRAGAAMTYDHARRRLILHGGHSGLASSGAAFEDTWEWDGQRWMEMPGSDDPPAQGNHVMAYDPGRGVVVLFGVDDVKAAATYEYDGANGVWSRRMPILSPPARIGATLVYDPTTSQLLLVGGQELGTGVAHGDAWSWNGITWSPQPPPPRDSVRGTAANDPIHDRVIVIGGEDTGNGAPSDTLLWNGAWSSSGTTLPPKLVDHAAVYDPVRGRAVVMETDPYELESSTWIARAERGVAGATMTFDTRRHIAFTFGGSDAAADTNALTAWEGSTLVTRVPVANAPDARIDSAIAYDERRDRLVLFGGAVSRAPTADTWEWDDSLQTWTQRDPVEQPPKRHGHVMGYDPIRDQLVLFGGQDDIGVFGDTWVFDSDADRWTEQRWDLPVVPPPARANAAIAWSYARRRLVLFGGQLGELEYNDTWEWDGSQWEPVITESPPTRRAKHAVTASATGVLVIGGQARGSSLESEVWELRWDSAIVGDSCRDLVDADGDGLAACEDPDCRAVCTPLCLPGADEAVCSPNAPTCGDGNPDPLETCRICPQDNPSCPITCGDFHCDPGETIVTCPGDCTP